MRAVLLGAARKNLKRSKEYGKEGKIPCSKAETKQIKDL